MEEHYILHCGVVKRGKINQESAKATETWEVGTTGQEIVVDDLSSDEDEEEVAEDESNTGSNGDGSLYSNQRAIAAGDVANHVQM